MTLTVRVLIAGLLAAGAVAGGLWLHGYEQTVTRHRMELAAHNGRAHYITGIDGRRYLAPGPVTYGPDRISVAYHVRVKPAWATTPAVLGGGIAILTLGAALIVAGFPSGRRTRLGASA